MLFLDFRNYVYLCFMRLLFSLCSLLGMGLSLRAQNVGIGTTTPASRLSVHGNLSVGNSYTGIAAPTDGAIIEGNTGIGTSAPAHRLHVVGDVRFVGDFVNQEITGSNVTTLSGGTVHSIPYNATSFPINGTTVSITIPDGSGVDHSGVFISGFARIVNNTTMTGGQALAGYFLTLVRAEDAAFTVNKTILTYTSGICALRFPNGLGNTTTGFNMGSSVSYVDLNLTAGMTYYYRLELYGNHINVNGGTLDVHERNLSVLQIKR